MNSHSHALMSSASSGGVYDQYYQIKKKLSGCKHELIIFGL